MKYVVLRFLIFTSLKQEVVFPLALFCPLAKLVKMLQMNF